MSTQKTTTNLESEKSSKWLVEPLVSVKVKKSYAGLGLFAEQDIQAETKIIEYVGDIITTEEADKRGGRYLFEVNSKITIDGKDRENLGRYLNHCCKPNCEARLKKDKIFFWAFKDIKKGDELTFDYGKEYMNEILIGTDGGCLCAVCIKKRERKAAKNNEVVK